MDRRVGKEALAGRCSLADSEPSGGWRFSFAQLPGLYWLGLLLGKGDIFLPPARAVKHLHLLFRGARYPSSCWACNQGH